MPKDIKKIKTKARYEISTIKLVLKIGTFEKKISPKLVLLYVSAGQTQFLLSQKNILVIKAHFWRLSDYEKKNPRKRPTLLRMPT